MIFFDVPAVSPNLGPVRDASEHIRPVSAT